MSRIEKAKEFRRAAVLAAQGASDEQALSMPSLYPEWAPGVAVGGEGQVSIVNYAGQLYRCRQPHTTQAGWEPVNYPAGWVAINNTNAGTISDPIPAVRGMEYEYGLHYADPEDGNTYKCERTGESAGGKIVLHFLPHELIGQYFVLADGGEVQS